MRCSDGAREATVGAADDDFSDDLFGQVIQPALNHIVVELTPVAQVPLHIKGDITGMHRRALVSPTQRKEATFFIPDP